MNITLSAKESIIKKVRQYAQERNTTLNKLIRDYLERLVSEENDEVQANRFLQMSEHVTGDSKGWSWNRDDLYDLG